MIGFEHRQNRDRAARNISILLK